MKRKSTGLYISLAVLMTAVVGLVFRNDIHDWIKLRGYNPPAEVIELADAVTFVDSSRRLFYVNRPVIADSQTFNQHCRDNEYTIVLGCYLPGQRGIYLLHVKDSRLDGVMEVTAAHELLHAAYERLSSSERTRVDAMLKAAYESLNNTRIKETIELYRRQDPGVVNNEIHSILGTEVANLPEELEKYYSRYFKNRRAVVEMSEKYERVFVERRNAIREYDEQLAKLKPQIDSLSSRLTRTDAELRNMRSQMNSLRASNQVDEYNAMVPVYNAKVNSYNRDVDRLSSMVVQYNDIVHERNSIAAEEAELVDAIDSRDVVPEQR